ncbi:MAG: ABC transporter substrate-binding protein [Deltaproteobacteria bacterium]|nr:ABC transporter substrate-binding protein [Deltaproteobacteria bacterium]
MSVKDRLGCAGIFVLVLALSFAGSPVLAQDSRPVVRVSSPGSDTAYSMPFRVAQELGFYSGEGLDVRILPGVRTAPSVQMLVAGTVEATQTVGPTTMGAILQGAPLKVVMIFNDKPSYWLYSKKNIRGFAMLKGSKVASSTPGSTNDRLLKIILEKNGVDWKRDLTIIYIGTSDVRIRALLSGSVDAAVLTLPGNLAAEDAGFHELASFESEVGALTGGVATNETLITHKRDTLVRFLRATLKGLKFFKDSRDGSAKIMSKYMHITPAAALRTYDKSVPVFVSNGMFSEEFQDKVVDFQLKAIGSDKKLRRDQVFDFSIMKALAKQG